MTNFVKELGDWTTVINPVAMVILSLFLTGWKGIIIYAVIYGVSALISQILKDIFDAPRPRNTTGTTYCMFTDIAIKMGKVF